MGRGCYGPMLSGGSRLPALPGAFAGCFVAGHGRLRERGPCPERLTAHHFPACPVGPLWAWGGDQQLPWSGPGPLSCLLRPVLEAVGPTPGLLVLLMD